MGVENAALCSFEKRAGHKTIGPTTVDPREGAPKEWTIEKRDQRINDPGPEISGVKDHDPTLEVGMRIHEPIPNDHISPEGSPGAPRFCAVRANLNLGPRPWEAQGFYQQPDSRMRPTKTFG